MSHKEGPYTIYSLAEYVAWQRKRLAEGRPAPTTCRIGPCTHQQEPDPEPEVESAEEPGR